jgi:hypothetical protein
MVVRAIDVVTPRIGRKEICLLMSKRKKIIGSKLNINYLQ